MKITCSDCGGNMELSVLYQSRYCVPCGEIREIEVDRKATARSKTYQAYKKGIISKLPCKKCGCEDSEMHHDDYDKPLEVVWFCRKCHLSHHKMKNIYELFRSLDMREKLHVSATLAKIIKRELIDACGYDTSYINKLDKNIEFSFVQLKKRTDVEEMLEQIKK